MYISFVSQKVQNNLETDIVIIVCYGFLPKYFVFILLKNYEPFGSKYYSCYLKQVPYLIFIIMGHLQR